MNGRLGGRSGRANAGLVFPTPRRPNERNDVRQAIREHASAHRPCRPSWRRTPFAQGRQVWRPFSERNAACLKVAASAIKLSGRGAKTSAAITAALCSTSPEEGNCLPTLGLRRSCKARASKGALEGARVSAGGILLRGPPPWATGALRHEGGENAFVPRRRRNS